MEKQQPPSATRPSPERDDVQVTLNRCPFCHDDVAALADDTLCCKSCLARHHVACWEESGACGSCGHTQALRETEPAGQIQTPPRPPTHFKPLTVCSYGLAVLASTLAIVGLYLGYEGTVDPLALGSVDFRPGFQPSLLTASIPVALSAGLGCVLASFGMHPKKTAWGWGALAWNLVALATAVLMSQLVA